MSQLLIQQYLNQLQDLRKVSGTHRESVVREAFKDLLKGWGRQHDLIFVPEYEIATPAKERRYVDGALLHELRVPFGYWEAKDEKDDLDAEIEFKFKRGYPQDNIIFEDSTEAVLIQNRQEVMRCGVDDVAALEKLLGLFFGYERVEIAEFRKAVEQFKTDLPAVLDALRDMIEQALARERRLPQGVAEVPRPRAGGDQPQPHRGRRARDADPARPDRGDLLQGVRRGRFPPPQQRRAGALQARSDLLHRRPEEEDAQGPGALLRGDPRRRRRRSAATTRSRPSSRSSTRTSTRSTTPRPPTAWAWCTRRTRSCAS